MLEPNALRGARSDLWGKWYSNIDIFTRLIHTSNGEHGRALEYYYQALERNPSLPQALNNIAVIFHYRAEQALENGQSEISKILFQRAADYWNEAIRLAPTSYLEAQSWLKQKTN